MATRKPPQPHIERKRILPLFYGESKIIVGSACGLLHNQPATQRIIRSIKATNSQARWLLLCIGAPL
ncbi:MAG: hypothetical protein ACQCN6_14610, partial [Candidatus Bathyarchaeia archaeon]